MINSDNALITVWLSPASANPPPKRMATPQGNRLWTYGQSSKALKHFWLQPDCLEWQSIHKLWWPSILPGSERPKRELRREDEEKEDDEHGGGGVVEQLDLSWLTTVVKHLLYKELAPARHEPRLPGQLRLKRLQHFPVKANLLKLFLVYIWWKMRSTETWT